jgi:hypothetical protein
LLRRFRLLKPFAQSVDENETGDLLWRGSRIQVGNQTTVGVSDQHERCSFVRCAEQGMQIHDRLCSRRRLPHRVTSARLLADRRSRTIVGANPRNIGHSGIDRRRRSLRAGPIVGGRLEAGDQNDRRCPSAAALKVHPAATVDVDETGDVGRSRWSSGQS